MQELNDEDKLASEALSTEGIIVEENPEEQIEELVGLFSKEEANRYAREFLSSYFAETTKVVVHEESFVKLVGHADIKIDFLKCRRFLTTAINNLKDIDFDLMKGTLQKLYRDTDTLFNFYAKFLQDNKNWLSVFETYFIKRVKPFQDLVSEMELCKSTRDSYDMRLKSSDEEIKKVEKLPQSPENLSELKKLKLNHGGLVHNFATARDKYNELIVVHDEAKALLRAYFEAVFVNYTKNLGSRLKYVVNFKAFCLDKLLWYEAQNNPHISSFFKRANIVDNYNMKTFISFYLKRIDMNKSKDNDWHMYLQELYESLEE